MAAKHFLPAFFLLSSAALQAQVTGGSSETLFHFEGTTNTERFASAIADLRDINHDAHDDLLIGNYTRSKAFVYSGLDGSVLHHFIGGTGPVHFSVDIPLSMDRFLMDSSVGIYPFPHKQASMVLWTPRAKLPQVSLSPRVWLFLLLVAPCGLQRLL